ncbi:MAG: DUF1569 domain-containing protein [Planctomycetaceae bacterium]
MASSTAMQRQRRKLRFQSSEEFLAEAERLAAGPYRLLGNWTYGQILDHLARGINNFYEGFGFQAPWHIRTIVKLFLKQRILTRGMTPGIQLPKSAASLLPATEVSTAEGLARLRAAVERLSREDPVQPHPFFGRLTPEEIRQLMLRHGELHLGFVIPE